MLEGLNDVLQRIAGIKEEIASLRNYDDEVSKQVRSSINDSLPRFARILNRKRTQAETELGNVIGRVSQSQGVDEALVRAVIETESGFDPQAVSEKGARGLMQLMPDTAAQLGVDPDDPVQNVEGGVRYLGRMIDRFDNLEEALAAYNAGPGAVETAGGIPPFPETQDYVKTVLERFRQYKQDSNS